METSHLVVSFRSSIANGFEFCDLVVAVKRGAWIYFRIDD